MSGSSRILDMNGMPVNSPEAGNGSTGKPAWDKLTKKELALSDEGMKILRVMAGKCIDFLEKHVDDEKAVQEFLDDQEKKWIRKAGEINCQLTKLNEGHVGYRHGRKPRYFVAKALEMMIMTALGADKELQGESPP